MHLEKHILHEHGRSPHKYQHAQGSNLSLAAAQPSRLTLRFMTERHLWCGRAACKACGEQLYQQGIAAASLVQVGSRAEARKQQRKAAQGCKQPTRRCASASVAERARVRLCLHAEGYNGVLGRDRWSGAAPFTMAPLLFFVTLGTGRYGV